LASGRLVAIAKKSGAPGTKAGRAAAIHSEVLIMSSNTESFPYMWSISAGMLTGPRVPVYTGTPVTPQLMFMRLPADSEAATKCGLFATEWNMLWEGGPYRPEHLRDELPPEYHWIDRVFERHIDLVFLPVRHNDEYEAYGPLYHLLPLRLIKKHRLPILERGHWPRLIPTIHGLSAASVAGLRRAFGELIWPLLTGGRSTVGSHPPNESLVMLAQDLGFWLPAMEVVLRRRGLRWGRSRVGPEDEVAFKIVRPQLPADLDIQTAAMGGPLWEGEDEAREVLHELMEVADVGGRIRGTVDAIRRGRVEEDFSPRWSREREDFDRKLFSKRSRVKTTFIELDDTNPVLGPHSELHENLLWRDMMTIVEPRDRHIVVLLQRGQTRVGDIADELGYANHSPVSKALGRIRKAAAAMFDISTEDARCNEPPVPTDSEE
jgi:hypothetical protein